MLPSALFSLWPMITVKAVIRVMQLPDLPAGDWNWTAVTVRWSGASGQFIFLGWSCNTWVSRQWDTTRSISIWMAMWMRGEATTPRPPSAICPSTTPSPAALPSMAPTGYWSVTHFYWTTFSISVFSRCMYLWNEIVWHFRKYTRYQELSEKINTTLLSAHEATT